MENATPAIFLFVFLAVLTLLSVSVQINILFRSRRLDLKPESRPNRFGPWREIRNEELTLSDVPSRDASWEQIKRFAGSFVAYNTPEFEQYNRLWGESRKDFLAGRKMALAGLSLSELRAVLFLDWRAIRHGCCGFEPPPDEMVYLWELIDAIRSRL